MNIATSRRLLFIRLDRIGDLILTLPVDESFRASGQVDWWITKGLGFVAEAARPQRAARELPRRIGLGDFLALLSEVRSRRYDAAVIFHAPWWVSFLLWLARVPIRAGQRSQWHSFLFLNRGIRQKRSRAEHSELEYNFRLCEECLGKKIPRASLRLESPLPARLGLSPRQYFVVHPGMAGSARNWPAERYIEFIEKCEGPVVVTGTASDEEYLSPLRARFQNYPRVKFLDRQLTGTELIGVLASAKAVLAPSTGVAHLAASTGARTLGIYSPVRVQHPRRWGPQGARVTTFVPKVECPGEMNCLGDACAIFDCMPKISADEVLAETPRQGPQEI